MSWAANRGQASMWSKGLLVTGTFKVQSPTSRIARNGQAFLVFRVPIGGVAVPVFAWPNECAGPTQLQDGDRIHLIGHSEVFAGRAQVRARRLAPGYGGISKERAWQRLRVIYQWLHPPVLQDFLAEVFADPTRKRRFALLPASQRHHHAYAGGLLEHSVEVAWQVFQQPAESPAAHSLATLAALLHDIGKLQTYREEGGFTAIGEQVSHDALTLEVLGPALALLDARWPEGGSRLRALLAENTRDPLVSIEPWKQTIQKTDQRSAALN